MKAKTVLPEENVEEGFASDAQRRAAFSGYKAKGKKGKKEEGLRQDLRDLKKRMRIASSDVRSKRNS